MIWFSPKFYGLIFLISVFILAFKYAEGECSFRHRSTTLIPSVNEYGSYRTKKQKQCLILKRSATISPIQTIGNPKEGELKLLYSPNIVLNKPHRYKPNRAYIYNVACPEGFLAYFKLLSLDLDHNSCEDHLEVHSSYGLLEKYCKDYTAEKVIHIDSSLSVTADISHVLFRSDWNASNNGMGFLASLVCFKAKRKKYSERVSAKQTLLTANALAVYPNAMSLSQEEKRINEQVPPLQESDSKTLDALSKAVFDVIIKGIDFTDEDLDRALMYKSVHNPILQAAARAILNCTTDGCPGLTNTQATSSPTPTKIYDIVDSCQSNPCHPSNSLNCTDGFSEYTCTCKTGFGGRNCGRVCPSGCDGYNCDSGESCITNPSTATPIDIATPMETTTPEAVCSTGELRLVGGANLFQGRVELCINNTWGTVCDDFWGQDEASVVCRQLGFSPTGASEEFYGAGTGQIWLDNVFCAGTELRLVDCPANPIGDHNCYHREDVGVRCQEIETTPPIATATPAAVCNNSELRLVGGANLLEGRVELCMNNMWGTVCDDFWGLNEASVVCRQLGFSPTSVSEEFFGAGIGKILLDDVFCDGTELRLVDCPSNRIGIHNCGHHEDVGVRCQEIQTTTPISTTTPAAVCNNSELRLVGGANLLEGRVELCINNVWGTVCDDYWGYNEASVVCRQLGFSHTGASEEFFGAGTGQILLDNVFCAGTELRLINCPANPIGNHNCGHHEDVGVRCRVITTGTLVCSSGELRLVGGANPLEGRIELCIGNIWGTVCDDYWGYKEASVVCRQLGFSPAGAIEEFFGAGTGQIWLDNVFCAGTELRLVDCPANPIGDHNCYHREDVGVRCQEIQTTTPISTTTPAAVCNNSELRLVGGANLLEGRVELCINNAWGTVCDDYWGYKEASVVCRQLGFSPTGAVEVSFGAGTGQILLDNVFCAGNELRLINCTANPIGIHNCAHREDVGVRCRAMETVAPLTTTTADLSVTEEPRCLQIIIKYARGLDDEDGLGYSDPYVRFTVSSISGESENGRTHFIQEDLSPNWNFIFNASCDKNWNRFYFRVYDKDVIFDDPLSSGQYYYLSNLPRCDLTLNLVGGSGRITFSMYYKSGAQGSC